jgi:anti-sigma factor RsiW
MGDRTDIDALLIGALYGELAPADEARLAAHLESHPADRTALADLSRTREAVRSSRVMTVQVEPPQKISALLIQEAARRLPRAEPGWFSRLMRMLMTHPAMAVAAMFVIIIGVAGTLHVRRSAELAEEPSTSAMSSEAAGEATGASSRSEGVATPPASPAAAPAAMPMVTTDIEQAPGAAPTPADDLAAAQADAPATVAPTTPGAGDAARNFSSKPQPSTSQLADANRDAAPAAPPPPPARVQGPSQGAGRKFANEPVPASGKDGDKAGEDKTLVGWARKQHDQVVALVKTSKCDEAANLATQIYARAPDYYNANVATDRSVKPCVSYLNREREREDRSRASKKAR